MSIDVSPDGETLVFDLLGDLYQLPIDGGTAVPLTSGTAWDRAPQFSSDGTQLYFVSDREGYKNLWQLTLVDRSLRQITQSETDILGGPNWSHDGSELLAGVAAPYESFSGEVVLNRIDPMDGTMTPVIAPVGPWLDPIEFAPRRQRTDVYSGVESTDGKVYYSERRRVGSSGRGAVRLYGFDQNSQANSTITLADATYSEFKPQLSNDDRLLAYFRQYDDRRTELRILDLKSGQDDLLVVLAYANDAAYSQSDDSRPNYAFTPDDRALVFWHAGKIRRVGLEDAVMEVIPFRVEVEREVVAQVRPNVQTVSESGEASAIRWPSLSSDGQTMVFIAIGYVWVMDMPTGNIRRLTTSDDFEFMPAISPDGQSVAYISFKQSGADYGPGRLMIADIDSKKSREVLSAPNVMYLLPRWSPDGSKIALIGEIDEADGSNAAFGWTLSAKGEFHEVAKAPPTHHKLSDHVYARGVGFDLTGEKLLFSYGRSLSKTILESADLNGGRSRVLAVGAPDVAGISPAPDLKTLVLTRRGGSVWTIPFDVGEEPVDVSTLGLNAYRISEYGGYYVDWNAHGQFTFGFAQNVYRYRLNDRELHSFPISVPFAKPMAVRPIVFKGARLVTVSGDHGAGPVIDSGTVVVDGARIAAVGPASTVPIPANAWVIDTSGKTILPGLLDTHYHRIGGGRSFSALVLPNPNYSDESAIAFGVTSAWEPAGPADDGAPALVDLQATGRIAGPRWSHSAIGGVGYPYEFLTSYDAALAAVEEHRELGVAVLKEYTAPRRDQRQWLSAAAHANGLGIVSHLQSLDGMLTRIVDGYTGGDHPHVPVPFYKDVNELLRQSGYIWTPNVLIANGTTGNANVRRRYCEAVFQVQKERFLGSTQTSSDTETKINCIDDNDSTTGFEAHRKSRVAKQVSRAASSGVRIGVSAHNFWGSNLHREMWLLWKGGMPIEDVLRATTMTNAEKLGLQEEIGSLEVGKIADFLILDENPLDDILNTLSLKYTVQGGVVYDSATAERLDVSSLARDTGEHTIH